MTAAPAVFSDFPCVLPVYCLQALFAVARLVIVEFRGLSFSPGDSLETLHVPDLGPRDRKKRRCYA